MDELEMIEKWIVEHAVKIAGVVIVSVEDCLEMIDRIRSGK